MPINRPYFSICRPSPGTNDFMGDVKESYFLDLRYSDARQQLIHAYGLLERHLEEVFDYVEPADGNLKTFSHELYQLLLRACTEVETNATGILTRNGYSRSGNWNVTDYYKIEAACRLSEYEVRVPVWKGPTNVRKPFAAWASGHSLPWYQDYNSVKHDRTNKFELANLGNVLDAVAGVLVILFAQFYVLAFTPTA